MLKRQQQWLRQKSASHMVFLGRLSLAWTIFKTLDAAQTHNNESEYFITRPAYISVELNAHNRLLLLLLGTQKQLPLEILNIYTLIHKLMSRSSEILVH